ncbi:MAG: hypothetical protein ACRCTD_08035 [Beijerinckiaceae bacterium]
MKKSALYCAIAIFGAALFWPAGASARIPDGYAAGLRLATRHHVLQPRCYAQVFARYAVLNRHGKWRWPAGRRSMAVQSAYRQELFNLCGVSA